MGMVCNNKVCMKVSVLSMVNAMSHEGLQTFLVHRA